MKELEKEEVVTIGSHVIVQRLDFQKIYRVSENGSLAMGKEEIKMNVIIGKPYWTTFKVISPFEGRDKKKKKGPPSTLVVAEKCESLEDLRKTLTSGYDNRSIKDDGKSQKLSKDDILGFRDAGKSGREIVTSLIENNVSFTEKTEYSQEKYIRKKEKKYCQFLSIHKPTISSIQRIYLRQDPSKINGLRMDTLAQLFSYSDVKSDGVFILYDSGTAGLVPAGMLSRIGAHTSGNLVYLHSGDHLPQMPIVRAMNFPMEQLDRFTTVSIFDFLQTYSSNKSCDKNEISQKSEDGKKIDEPLMTEKIVDSNELTNGNCDDKPCDTEDSNSMKRKRPDDTQGEPVVMKKSRKVLDMERGVRLLTDSKADSLVIVTKEHPLNIIKELLPFVKSSRPFVVYHSSREPLQEAYLALKQQCDVVNLKIFSNFLRSYQVLADRTHPDILTNDCGGYLLTGYTVS